MNITRLHTFTEEDIVAVKLQGYPAFLYGREKVWVEKRKDVTRYVIKFKNNYGASILHYVTASGHSTFEIIITKFNKGDRVSFCEHYNSVKGDCEYIEKTLYSIEQYGLNW